jgi:hypothetical protein
VNTNARWLVAMAGPPTPQNFQVMCWPVDPVDDSGPCFVPLMTDPEPARRLADAINAQGWGGRHNPTRFEATRVDSPAALSALLNKLRQLNRVEFVTIDLLNPGQAVVPAESLVPIAAAIFDLDVER